MRGRGNRVCPQSAVQVIFPSSARRVRSGTAATRKTKLSSVRYVNSGFQTHSQQMNTHCWGKAEREMRVFLSFCAFQVTRDEIECGGAREIGHGVYLEANCTTPGDKAVSNKLPDTTKNLNVSFLQ